MTELDKMEELSKRYLEIIANNTGYFNSTSRDYGTDLTIRKAKYCPNRKRLLTTGKALDIQLKAVTEKYVSDLNNPSSATIKYVLEVKNYNDLIDRANENGLIIPLLLVVFIMPDKKADWVELIADELILRKCAYWYQIPINSVYSPNKTTVTIKIPKSNKISMDFYIDQFLKLD